MLVQWLVMMVLDRNTQCIHLFPPPPPPASSGANEVAAHIKGAHVLAGMMRPVVVAVQQAVALEHLVLAMAANPIGHVRMILPEMVAKLVPRKVIKERLV